MKKRILAIFVIAVCLFGSISVYAMSDELQSGQTTQIMQNTQITQQNTQNVQADLTTDSTVNLVKIKDRELKSMQDYKDAYGNDTYGLVAYILNVIRIYSIPFGFLGIAVSGIFRYVIGIRRLDARDKGFGAMIGIITVMVMCQVLPLIFAIVVKGWRG